jgi:hypothetical protein
MPMPMPMPMMRIAGSQHLQGDSFAGKPRSNKIKSAALGRLLIV